MSDTEKTEGGVKIQELDEVWGQSTGEPFTLFTQDSPPVQAGSYVIQPGERVPEEGTTSHDGPEISVILSGEVALGLNDAEYTIGPNTLVIIPEGVEHYSENRTEDPCRLVYTVLGDL